MQTIHCSQHTAAVLLLVNFHFTWYCTSLQYLTVISTMHLMFVYMLCIWVLTHQPGLCRLYYWTVLLAWLTFLCSHAMLCGLCKIMRCNAGMRFPSLHTTGCETVYTDKSMCMQIPSSCGPLHEAQLHYTCINNDYQIQLVAIFKECMHNHRYLGSLNLCYQKKYLWCLYQQQNGETALTFACKKDDLRSVELLLKASADPNHITMVSTTGKQYLLPFPNFLNF